MQACTNFISKECQVSISKSSCRVDVCKKFRDICSSLFNLKNVFNLKNKNPLKSARNLDLSL